ncbi:MAG: MBL fold metallo-hydrolase [Bacteroidota bacterium]
MNSFLKSGMVLLLFLLQTSLKAQDRIEPKKLHQIEPHVYLFQGGGDWALNSLILEDKDGLILIDTQFADENNELLILALREKFPNKKLNTIVVSHPHADHFMGIPLFQKEFGTKEIIGIKGENKHLRETAHILYPFYEQVSPNKKIALDKLVYPNKEIASGFELSFSNRLARFELIGQNESWNSWILYLPDSKLLYTGDLYWDGLTLDPEGFGSSLLGWEKELRKIMNREVGKVVPGHGVGLFNRKSVDDFLYHLSTFIANGKSKIEKGMSRENFIKDESHGPLNLFGDRTSILGHAYDELKAIVN